MKNINLIISSLVLGLTLVLSGCGAAAPKAPEPEAETKVEAPAKLVDMEKQGFLTVKSCADAGVFQDCYLENYMCGTDGCYLKSEPGVISNVEIALYVHKEGITYNIDISGLPASDIDKGINRNDVTIIGKYNEKTNTIIATEFKSPPPPKKSFFKGCL